MNIKDVIVGKDYVIVGTHGVSDMLVEVIGNDGERITCYIKSTKCSTIPLNSREVELHLQELYNG
jgi:hypothetical protein